MLKMLEVEVNIAFAEGIMQLAVARYSQDGSIALQLAQYGEDGYLEPVARLTVCIPDHPPKAGCVWIKSWSENEGVLEWITEDAKLASPTGRAVACGYALAYEVMLDKQILDLAEANHATH